MTAVAAVIAVMISVIYSVWLIKYLTRIEHKIFYETAERYRLNVFPTTFFSNVIMRGRYHKKRIKIKSVKRKGRSYLKVIIDFRSSFPGNFSVENEHFLSFLKFTEDKNIGESEFDSRYLLSGGSDIAITAISSFDFRRYINDLNEICKYFKISNNKVEAEVEKTKINSSQDLDNVIEHCLKIVNEINRPDDIRKRLIENSRFDPNRKVQAANLKMLHENYKEDSEIAALIDEIKNYEIPQDRILAAPYLGEEGMMMALGILENEKLDNESVCDAVKILEIQKVDSDYMILKELLENNRDENVIAVVIHVAGKLGLSVYEKNIFPYLDHDSKFIRELSIEAISECGTAKSVEKLHEMMDDSMNPFSRKKYSEAIAKIQSRLGDVEKGWVSVENTDNLDGALSKDKNEDRGGLSVHKERK